MSAATAAPRSSAASRARRDDEAVYPLEPGTLRGERVRSSETVDEDVLAAAMLLACGRARLEASICSQAEQVIASFIASCPEPQSELCERLGRLLSLETRLGLARCGRAEVRALLETLRGLCR